jgi:phage-related tail fiber protein
MPFLPIAHPPDTKEEDRHDLRGEFIRAWDNGRGADPGRAFGSAQGDAIRNITGSITGGVSSAGCGYLVIGGAGAFVAGDMRKIYGANTTPHTANNTLWFDASRIVPTAAENRSRNTALPVYVKF